VTDPTNAALIFCAVGLSLIALAVWLYFITKGK